MICTKCGIYIDSMVFSDLEHVQSCKEPNTLKRCPKCSFGSNIYRGLFVDWSVKCETCNGVGHLLYPNNGDPPKKCLNFYSPAGQIEKYEIHRIHYDPFWGLVFFVIFCISLFLFVAIK